MKSCLTGDWKAAEAGVLDDIFVGYTLKSIPPTGDLEVAREMVAAALAPAGREFALRELDVLRLTTRDHRELGDKDVKLMMRACAEKCGKYPADILTAACEQPPYWEFWPPLGKLLERMDSLIEPRRQIEQALSPESVERLRRRLEAEAEARRLEAECQPPTEEEKAAVSDLVRQAREALTGVAPKKNTMDRPAWWQGSRTQMAFRAVVNRVNAAAAHLGGEMAFEAWELAAAGQKAGSLRAMAPDARKRLLELNRMAKSAGVKLADKAA